MAYCRQPVRQVLNSDEDVLRIAQMLEGKRADATLRNYKSAMRQYVAMVNAGTHGQDDKSSEREATISKQLRNEESDLHIATAHNLYSSYREMLLEHLFSGEILRHLWLNGNSRVEILKPQVDDAGYDLVLEANGVVRHIQLKASHTGSSTSEVKVSLSLREKPSGCVVWIWFDPETLSLGPFLWFGGSPGTRLPELSSFKIAKHTKGNSKGVKLERPNFRVVPKSQFELVSSVSDLCVKLFEEPSQDNTG